MNLHGIAKGYVGAVNPLMPVGIRVSVGSTVGGDGKRTPTYATPGSLTASIAGTVLTATAVPTGKLQAGQLLSDLTSALLPGTLITGLLAATGGPGTYSVNQPQTIASEAMTTAFVAQGQVQAMTAGDLRQVEGLNLNGTKRGIYLDGSINGVVRVYLKGGDLITFPDGSTWLVAMVLEQWPDWCKVAATLQDGA